MFPAMCPASPTVADATLVLDATSGVASVTISSEAKFGAKVTGRVTISIQTV